MPEYRDEDICVECGAFTPSKLWGATCPKCSGECVHLVPCTSCKKEIGIIVDDDYCGPETIYCPSCVEGFNNKT